MPSQQQGWKIYKDQMSLLGHGDALWEPAPNYGFKRVKLGDVGYIRRGRFHLLFSAGCSSGDQRLDTGVPENFVPLTVGRIIRGQPRPPGHLSTGVVLRESGTGQGTLVDGEPALDPCYEVKFDLTDGEGAALVSKHRTYREDVELESRFKAYIKRHYNSWVRFARDKGHGDNVKPVLVTGVDLTQKFAMMAYSGDDHRLESKFKASALVDPASDWGTWYTVGLVHKNCGPRFRSSSSTRTTPLTTPGGEETTPEEYDQCVFIRYFTIRKRAFVFPTVMRAAAGPHDLGPGDHEDDEIIRMDTYSDSDSLSSCSDAMSWDEDDDRNLITDEDAHVVIDEPSSAWSFPSHPVHFIHPQGGKEDQGEKGKHLHGGDERIDPEDADELDEEGEEEEDLDKIAEYIFRNSDAESALLHHRDITLVRKPGDNRDIALLLAERRPRVRVDEDQVGKICSPLPPVESIANSEYWLTLHNFLQRHRLIDRLSCDRCRATGPDDKLTWTVLLSFENKECGRGTGPRLMDAKNEAARQVIRHLFYSAALPLVQSRER